MDTQSETANQVGTLYTDLITAKTGPRGGQKMQCKCGWSVYTSDRNWLYKTCEHLMQHGQVGIAINIEMPKPLQPPKPQLRRVK